MAHHWNYGVAFLRGTEGFGKLSRAPTPRTFCGGRDFSEDLLIVVECVDAAHRVPARVDRRWPFTIERVDARVYANEKDARSRGR